MTLELFLNRQYYATHPYIIDKISKNCKHRSDAGIFGMFISNTSDSKFGSGAEKGKANRVACIIHEARLNIENRRWCSMISLIALSNVVGRNIKSIYPASSDFHETISNGMVYARENSVEKKQPLLIMWSRTQSVNEFGTAKFMANHFVPIFIQQKIMDPLVDDSYVEKPPKLMKLDGRGSGM